MRLWKILKKGFAAFRYMNPTLGTVAHIFRLKNFKESMQILKSVDHFPAMFPKK